MNSPKTSRDPSFILLYSPQRFDRRFGAVKPEGSLGITYLAGALRENNYQVEILDCSVGNHKHKLEDTFCRERELQNGMIRVGLTTDEILKEVEPFDVVGVSSIFTAQTTMVVEVIEAISHAFPGKLILTGGVNARSQMELFFKAGAHLIATGEADKTILEIAQRLRSGRMDFRDIKGLAFYYDGQVKVNCPADVIQDLDELPIPAWDLQPMQKYWQIARPHGGGFSAKNPEAYAPLMTSRGCPFRCDFCHIANEQAGSFTGNLRKLRLKSISRVMREIEILRDQGVTHVFLEDDSLLGKKDRAKEIFRGITKLKINLSGVNGVNIAHMCTVGDDNKYDVDEDLLSLMAEAGFKKIMLPVESGSQRIIDKYATKKLSLKEHNIVKLIKTLKSLGMQAGGNYTFGYPDETEDEVDATFELAKVHMAAGLDNANFMMITPFPGTPFFTYVMENNLLLPDTKIDELDWTKPSIKNPFVDHKKYNWIIYEGWKLVNKEERVNRIREMNHVPTDF